MSEVILTEDEQLYIDGMDAWIKEHKERITDYEDCEKHARVIADLNAEQARIARKRYELGVSEYNDWRKEKGLDPTEQSRT